MAEWGGLRRCGSERVGGSMGADVREKAGLTAAVASGLLSATAVVARAGGDVS